MSETVLCIYDTRNIQRYIFSPGSDEVQIGAGILLARIMPVALEAALKDCGLKEGEYRLSYEDDPEYIPFFDREDMMAELAAIGGGNALVLYRDRELCEKVNRFFSRYILEHTHSMQVDIGIITKTDSFSNDINRIYRQADYAKSRGIISRPMGGLPIVQTERETGYALAETDPVTGEKISMDNYYKRQCYPAEFEGFDSKDGTAYIHIDGNEVSLTVNNVMNSTDDYREGIAYRRRLNGHIAASYQAALDYVGEYLSKKYGGDINRYYQVLNFGGDDINLRCKKEMATEVAIYFMDSLRDKYLWESDVMGRVPFSVSVGIAYVSGSLTFAEGQRMAAKACGNAKIMAKKPENRSGKIAGNWMDYCVFETELPDNLPEHPCVIPGRTD